MKPRYGSPPRGLLKHFLSSDTIYILITAVFARVLSNGCQEPGTDLHIVTALLCPVNSVMGKSASVWFLTSLKLKRNLKINLMQKKKKYVAGSINFRDLWLSDTDNKKK